MRKIKPEIVFDEIFHLSCMEYVKSTPASEDFIRAIKSRQFSREDLFLLFSESEAGYDKFVKVFGKQALAKSKRFEGVKEYADKIFGRPGRVARKELQTVAFLRIMSICRV